MGHAEPRKGRRGGAIRRSGRPHEGAKEMRGSAGAMPRERGSGRQGTNTYRRLRRTAKAPRHLRLHAHSGGGGRSLPPGRRGILLVPVRGHAGAATALPPALAAPAVTVAPSGPYAWSRGGMTGGGMERAGGAPHVRAVVPDRDGSTGAGSRAAAAAASGAAREARNSCMQEGDAACRTRESASSQAP